MPERPFPKDDGPAKKISLASRSLPRFFRPFRLLRVTLSSLWPARELEHPEGSLQLIRSPQLDVVPKLRWPILRPFEPLGSGPIRRIPRNPAFNRLPHISRSKQLRPKVLVEVLGLRTIAARTVAEEKPLVQIFIDQMLVYSLRTLGATDRIYHQLALDPFDAHEIGYHALHDAE